jgi:DNA gyrase inhibitor GyrI
MFKLFMLQGYGLAQINYTFTNNYSFHWGHLVMKEMEVRIERLSTLCTAYSCSFSATPEEDAAKTLMEWAKNKRLLDKGGARLFGRNTFPTDKPEPRGYELHLTIDENLKTGSDIETSEVPAGLYAVLRFRDLRNISLAWEKLWSWIEKSEYEHAGWSKGNMVGLMGLRNR